MISWLAEDPNDCKKEYLSILREWMMGDSSWKTINLSNCTIGKPVDHVIEYLDMINCNCNPGQFFLTQDSIDNCKPGVFKYALDYRTQTIDDYANSSSLVINAKPIRMISTSVKRAMDFNDFLSQVGGFMGLLLGASALTLVEFLEFSAISFHTTMHRLLGERSRQRVESIA